MRSSHYVCTRYARFPEPDCLEVVPLMLLPCLDDEDEDEDDDDDEKDDEEKGLIGIRAWGTVGNSTGGWKEGWSMVV